MKRMLSIVLAVCLMMAAAAPATAALSSGHLIQVMYEGAWDSNSGNEYYTDLGDWDALPQATKIYAHQPSITDYGDITLAFFAQESVFSFDTWSTRYEVMLPSNLDYAVALGSPIESSKVTTMQARAGDISGTSGESLSKGDTYSYKNQLQMGEQGYYRAALTSNYAPGERLLDGLTGANTSVDMYLYRYVFGDASGNVFVNPDGDLQADPISFAKVRVGLDEAGLLYTEINPNPIPVPGAALLFGSGLLGFFGIRRKKS